MTKSATTIMMFLLVVVEIRITTVVVVIRTKTKTGIQIVELVLRFRSDVPSVANS
jgi:hypothetical protein